MITGVDVYWNLCTRYVHILITPSTRKQPHFSSEEKVKLRDFKLASKGQGTNSDLDTLLQTLHALHHSALLTWKGPDTELWVRLMSAWRPYPVGHTSECPASCTLGDQAGRPPLPWQPAACTATSWAADKFFTWVRDSFLSQWKEKATWELLPQSYFWPWERIAWCCQCHRNHVESRRKGMWGREWMDEWKNSPRKQLGKIREKLGSQG